LNLKKNVAYSYIAQFFTIALGIGVLPIYILNIGAEGYGLIGLFTMLFNFFSLLDIGITPTLSRETARFRSGVTSPNFYAQTLRLFKKILLLLGITGLCFLLFLSLFFHEKWITAVSLSIENIKLCLIMMSFTIFFRWLCNLPRGVLTGAEEFVWLSKLTIVISFIRYLGVLIPLHYYGYDIRIYFIYQLAVSILELVILKSKQNRIFPSISPSNSEEVVQLKTFFAFSLSVALSSLLWTLSTQTDKLLLSALLDLNEYGYLSFSVLIAGGVLLLLGPLSSTILPRLTSLHASQKHDEKFDVYSISTQIMSVIVAVCVCTLVLSPQLFLFAWTGDSEVAKNSFETLALYSIGNCLLVYNAFPYYLQYAEGKVKFHLGGNILFFVTLLPLMFFLVSSKGAIGAGLAWTIINGLYFLLYVPICHKFFFHGRHFKWLIKDILLIVTPPVALTYIFTHFILDSSSLNRIESSFLTLAIIGLSLTLALFSSPYARYQLKRILNG
jgi:O-antigen/teichoic acid export membrane protein